MHEINGPNGPGEPVEIAVPESSEAVATDDQNPEKLAVKHCEVWFVTDNQPGFKVWADQIFKSNFKTTNFTSFSVEGALRQSGSGSPDLIYFGDRISPADRSAILGEFDNQPIVTDAKEAGLITSGDYINDIGANLLLLNNQSDPSHTMASVN